MLVVREFALAVDRTVFERLAFLAVLAALLLRMIMFSAVDLLQGSAVLFNFFQDIRCCYCDFGLPCDVFVEKHFEVFFQVDWVVLGNGILG